MRPSPAAKILFGLTAALLAVPPILPENLAPAAISAGMVPIALVWLAWSWRRSQQWRAAAASLVLVAVGVAMLVAAGAWQLSALHATLARYLTGGAYILGLLWSIWLVDQASRHYEAERRALAASAPPGLTDVPPARAIWNPLDPAAWYFGRHRSKLNQSTALLAAYSLIFVISSLLVAILYAKGEAYDSPAGGGGGGAGGAVQQMAMAQTVRVQKVIKKRFVINPFSAIKFTQAQIDDVKLQLEEKTDHLYKVGFGQGGAGSGKGKGFGYGDGEGSGFGNGTSDGKIRFIRLEYAGGDWNQDFGVGADLNLLIEYGIRTNGTKVSDRTESRTVAQLAGFPTEKSPPLVYLTGQGNITFSKAEVKSLRGYLLDKHGMLFGDNGGSRHFHNQFFAMMRQVLPDIEPVRVPLDDQIHRVPFGLPFLPYVAPHGGKEAWGWKVDGRWVCYYHPGDIGDAWSDGHSGVPREVWDACYNLGVNVIFYAHVEYAKWIEARRKR